MELLGAIHKRRAIRSFKDRPADRATLGALIAAATQGLGSCWVGFSRPWPSRPAAKRALGLSDDWSAVVPLANG